MRQGQLLFNTTTTTSDDDAAVVVALVRGCCDCQVLVLPAQLVRKFAGRQQRHGVDAVVQHMGRADAAQVFEGLLVDWCVCVCLLS